MAEQADAPQGAPEDDPQVIFIDEKERLNQAVTAVHAANGLVKADGSLDNEARARRAVDLIAKEDHVAEEPSERPTKAMAEVDLVKGTFSQGLVGPAKEEYEAEEDPAFAEKVYRKCASLVRGDAKMDKSGKVQKLVGEANGLPEMILCWTKIGKHQVPSVYLTRDLRCLLLDNGAILQQMLVKDAEKSANNMAEWITRVPDHAEALDKAYRKSLKKAQEAGQRILTAAVDQAVLARGESPGDEDE
jgi:hypothetical protein